MVWRKGTYALPLGWLRIGMGLLPLLVGAIWAWQTWTQKESAAIETSRQNAALISEYAQRLLQTQKLLLNQIGRILEENPAIDGFGLHERLRALDAGMEFTTSLGVVTAEGSLVAGSRTYPLHMDLSQRAYFTALRDHDLPLFIDRIVLQPAGRDSLTVATRLPGEGFRGIATASADIVLFTDFLAGISAAQDSAAFLMRADGKLLVRPDPAAPPVQMVAGGEAMKAIAAAPSGVFDAPGRMDGTRRIYAYQKIGDLPLFAMHGFAYAGLVADVVIEMLPIGLFLLACSVLGYIALSSAMKQVEAERARGAAEFDRKLLNEAQQTAALKEALLKEMNHRIHNNLQMIQSLIHMRSRAPGDPATVLKEIGKRVWAISEVHNLLYNSAEYSHLDLGAFIRTMANSPGIVPPEQGIAVRCDTDRVDVEIQQAVPVALIVLECLTNALKHAFPDERLGTVTITLRQMGDHAEVVVADDGVGTPSIRNRNSGMKLSQALAEQIHATMDMDSVISGGTTIRLRFPLLSGEQRPHLKVVEPGSNPVAAA